MRIQLTSAQPPQPFSGTRGLERQDVTAAAPLGKLEFWLLAGGVGRGWRVVSWQGTDGPGRGTGSFPSVALAPACSGFRTESAVMGRVLGVAVSSPQRHCRESVVLNRWGDPRGEGGTQREGQSPLGRREGETGTQAGAREESREPEHTAPACRRAAPLPGRVGSPGSGWIPGRGCNRWRRGRPGRGRNEQPDGVGRGRWKR